VRAFEAASRRENFTEAAQELGMTQAAVSYQVRLLEERIGMPLFHRVGRRVELTPRGQALAQVVIHAFDDMRAGFTQAQSDDAAILTISCSNSFAHLWLAPRIGRFQMIDPDLAVRLQATDRIVTFEREAVDIAIRGSASASWPGLSAEKLMRGRIKPLCSPDFLARHGPFHTAADLLKTVRLSPLDYWWDEWLAAMDVDAGDGRGRASIALDSQMMEGRAALAGQGVAILNPFFWQTEIEAGLLIEPVPSDVVEGRRYWVVYPTAHRNQPKIKAFRDWIMAEMAEEQARDVEGRYLPKGV
jgi:LysR family glycine cleavage system transcriptional activator